MALSESIEHGIIAANENSERANLIRSYRKTVGIGQFTAAYQENQRIKMALLGAFEGSEFCDRLQEIQDILKNAVSPKAVYLDSMRRFGLKGGQTVYRTLKSCQQLQIPLRRVK